MRMKQVGNKNDIMAAVVRNAEASVDIPRGTPLVLVLNATNDGMDVVLPATAGNPQSFAYKYGIATDTIKNKQFGESFLMGYCPYALVTRATRAATTDSWTSSNSSAATLGLNLAIDTLNNALLIGASSAGSLPSANFAVLVDSMSVIAASASATSDTRTAIVQGFRVFLRMM